MTTEDEIWQRQAEKDIVATNAEIDRLNVEISKLMKRRTAQERNLEKLSLTAAGVKPCLVCNRHVASPCNSAGGMAEAGPWDGFCREFMENRNA